MTMSIPSYVEVDTQHCGRIFCSDGNCLDEVYGRYSVAKAYAWEYCESLCRELDGRHLCITSANTYMFTAQFEFKHPENGRPMVCHITPSRTSAMYLDMRNIETARDAWIEYATIFSDTTAWPDLQHVFDGVHVMWVDSVAYIIAYDEVYRVIDAWTANHKLRKRVKFQRVGAVDDDVIGSIFDNGNHQADGLGDWQ